MRRSLCIAGCMLLGLAAHVDAATFAVPTDYPSIQSAIDAASVGDKIFVLPGYYREHIVLKSGVHLIGSGASHTTIAGDGTGAVVFARSVTDVLVTGFRIQGPGQTCWSDPGSPNPPHGANVAILESQVTILDNELVGSNVGFQCGVKFFASTGLIHGNRIVGHDAPIACLRHSSPTISNNLLTENAHGIFSHVSEPLITQNLIVDNRQYGIYYVFGEPTILANTIIGNEHYGIFATGFDLPVLIANNLIAEQAVGVRFEQSIPRVISNTIVRNGYGFELASVLSTPQLFNNIVALSQNASLRTNGSCPAAMAFNDFYGAPQDFIGCADPGDNYFFDPGFRDPSKGDYRLMARSLAIDAGSNAAADLLLSDFDGKARIIDGNGDGVETVDLGAFEFDPNEDTDSDGILESQDQCPSTPVGEVVNESGCSISQLCPCAGTEAGAWESHREYLSCIVKIVGDFVDSHFMAKAEGAKIIAAAARSSCGKT